ncbi:hypothetical protein CXG53_18805 [Pseudomonas guariconensis]|uniref:Uncharacterized protein n=1 Tax=Pseudomonas guariconensis TaxID=1288410 RepID=A0AAX0VT45_9PSED|nr:hypothetical protein CXG49_17650 [Pseudomonas guariconensis]PLV22600.1 hypothetical protein CXG53_18805 [Pseudomonas guariconensis]PLV27623.1 hypothetical protein CXG51_19280 [Pseudomonas guariconensis]
MHHRNMAGPRFPIKWDLSRHQGFGFKLLTRYQDDVASLKNLTELDNFGGVFVLFASGHRPVHRELMLRHTAHTGHKIEDLVRSCCKVLERLLGFLLVRHKLQDVCSGNVASLFRELF